MNESNPARAELVVKKLLGSCIPECILSALDRTYIECHAGGPDSTMHNHCLLSKDCLSVLNDPSDQNDPSPSIPIGKKECLDYILYKLTANFSHGQVPWQC